ncbi:integrase, partial [Escherichia coli]|nr:integrase [Escherichia coli]
PYPATVGCRNGLFVVTLHDFDLETRAETRELAISHASVLLLRTLAQAAQRGERVPTPGELPANIDERVMICPLTNDQLMTKAPPVLTSPCGANNFVQN